MRESAGFRRHFLVCGLSGVLCLLLSAPAGAAVKLTPKKVIVTSEDGRAVITRSPFGMSFKDRRKRTKLRELGNQRLGPIPLPETEDPEPYSVERDPDNSVYSPLTYEVGTELHEQWNGALWPGDTLFSRRSGTTHSARRVLTAEAQGEGALLVLATSENRRRLVLRVFPDSGGGIRVKARPSSSRGVITVGDSFAAAPGEAFHGFGGRHGTVDKRGEKLYGFTEQENLGGEETITTGLALLPLLVEQGTDYNVAQLGPVPIPPNDLPGGYERYLFPNGMNAAYWPQASFISSRGYAFLVNQPQYLRWRMGNDRPDAWQVQASAPFLDYTVFFGPGRKRAIRELTAVTGRHRLPPAWAQGPMLSRAVQVPALPGLPAAESASSYRNKIEQDLADMEANGVRPSAYAFEGWALLQDLSYVRSVIQRLHARGIRAVLYLRAYVANDTLNTQMAGDYEETIAKGLVAKNAGGGPYIFEGQRRRARDAPRLHQPEDPQVVEAAPQPDARPRHGRLHAGLRRAGPGRHALPQQVRRVRDAQPLPDAVPQGLAPDPRPLEGQEAQAARDLVLHPRRLQRTAGQRRL